MISSCLPSFSTTSMSQQTRTNLNGGETGREFLQQPTLSRMPAAPNGCSSDQMWYPTPQYGPPMPVHSPAYPYRQSYFAHPQPVGYPDLQSPAPHFSLSRDPSTAPRTPDFSDIGAANTALDAGIVAELNNASTPPKVVPAIPMPPSSFDAVDNTNPRPIVDLSPVTISQPPQSSFQPPTRTRPLTLPTEGTTLKRDFVLGEFVAVETKVDQLEHEVTHLRAENDWLKEGLNVYAQKLNNVLAIVSYLESHYGVNAGEGNENIEGASSPAQNVKRTLKQHPKIAVR